MRQRHRHTIGWFFSPLWLGFFLLSAGAVRADAPGEINYQGKLTDANGNPRSSPPDFSMRFRVYPAGTDPNSPSVGTHIYESQPLPVRVTNGVFNARVPVPAWTIQGGTERWLEVVVEGAPMRPLHKLMSVPYALAVATGSISDAEVAANAGINASKIGPGTFAPGVYILPGVLGLNTPFPVGRLQVGRSAPSVADAGGLVLGAGTGAGGARQYWLGAANPSNNNSNNFTIGDYGVEGAASFRPLLTLYGEHMGTSAGRLGIGTETPGYKLDVAGDINFTGKLYDKGQEAVFSNWTRNGGNIYRMSHVGVGTTDPQAKLDITADTANVLGWYEAIRFSQSVHSAITHPGSGLFFGMHSDRNFYWGDTTVNPAIEYPYPMTLSAAGYLSTKDGVDMGGRGRVRQRPGGPSAGISFHQAGTDRAFVGLADDNQLGLWIPGGGGGAWGMLMNVNNGDVRWGLGANTRHTFAGSIAIQDNTQANGRVLTSDAGGVGSWKPVGVPSGAVMFFDAGSCPEDWTRFSLADGRYLLGANQGIGRPVGTALQPLPGGDYENRPVGRHSHGIQDPGHNHAGAAFIKQQGGGSMATRAGTESQTVGLPNTGTGITIDNAGAVDGTNAPFIQLLACKKN